MRSLRKLVSIHTQGTWIILLDLTAISQVFDMLQTSMQRMSWPQTEKGFCRPILYRTTVLASWTLMHCTGISQPIALHVAMIPLAQLGDVNWKNSGPSSLLSPPGPRIRKASLRNSSSWASTGRVASDGRIWRSPACSASARRMPGSRSSISSRSARRTPSSRIGESPISSRSARRMPIRSSSARRMPIRSNWASTRRVASNGRIWRSPACSASAHWRWLQRLPIPWSRSRCWCSLRSFLPWQLATHASKTLVLVWCHCAPTSLYWSTGRSWTMPAQLQTSHQS